MTDGLLTHPTPEQLAEFATGRLSDVDSAVIEQHLETCVDCSEWLKQSPGQDSYVGLLREAAASGHAPHEGAATQTTLGADTDGPKAPRTPDERRSSAVEGVPPELANHARYRMIRALGSGGMGQVFEAEHRLMRRRVALKMIKPQWLQSSAAVSRFRREMQAAAKLVHPHVVTAFDAEQAGDLHFLAMEFFNGVNLAELVSERGPLPVEMAVECIRQATLGLQYAHEHGMVHRDIKPGNLMVAESQSPSSEGRDSSLAPAWPLPLGPRHSTLTLKILDFGLARFASEEVDGTETSEGTTLGTPDFMAPEQARNAREADIRSDLYSLGCTLYFLLTGEVPHRGAKTALERALAHVECVPQRLANFRNDIPQELQAVLDRMLAKRPEDRFQTPAELAAALTRPTRLASIGDETPSPHQARPLTAGLQRVLLAIGLVGFVLIMAVIVQVVTDKADLQIQSADEGVVIVLRQNDLPMRRITTRAGLTTIRLLTGEYTLDLQDSTSDLRLSTRHVVLTRGRAVKVNVSTGK